MAVTQVQLAKKLGVSQRTVSVALSGSGHINEVTRARVLKQAQRLGYRPNHVAASLKNGRTRTLGAVWAFNHPWTGDAQIGMDLMQRVQARGMSTYQVHHGDSRAIDQLVTRLGELVSRQVDAIAIRATPEELLHPQVLRLIRDTPTVAISREDLPDFPGDLVVHDRTAAIHEVVDHLVGSGRRRIGFALSSQEPANVGKIASFQQRLRHHELPRHAHELIDLARPDSFQNHGERHRDAMQRQFPERVDLDAIFAFHDVGAMYIANDLQRRGLRVPEDVALVGFNDTEPAAVWQPPLATGDRRYAQAADAMDRLLERRMAQPDLPPQRHTIAMRFIWRASAGGDPTRTASHSPGEPES
jgi:DNA-binding LacI/PurR family transcriptional regulator